jgi:hypothetical protein
MLCLVTSCYFGKYPKKPITTLQPIQLGSNRIPERLLTYENKGSITYLDINDIIRLVDSKLKDKSLCEQKRINYNKLLAGLKNNGKDGYVIIPTINPSSIKEMMSNMDTTKTGFAPLDFYTRLLGVDLNNAPWIPPYGYIPQFTDTLNSIKYDSFYDWITTELIIKGKAKIYRKSENKFQDTVYYEIVNFRDGHGGESLLFTDKKIFMNVKVYTDMIMPDFECMDSTELKANGWIK